MESKWVILTNGMVHVDFGSSFLKVRIVWKLSDANCYLTITVCGPVVVCQGKIFKVTLAIFQIKSSVSDNTERYFLNEKNQQHDFYYSQSQDTLKMVKLGR